MHPCNNIMIENIKAAAITTRHSDENAIFTPNKTWNTKNTPFYRGVSGLPITESKKFSYGEPSGEAGRNLNESPG